MMLVLIPPRSTERRWMLDSQFGHESGSGIGTAVTGESPRNGRYLAEVSLLLAMSRGVTKDRPTPRLPEGGHRCPRVEHDVDDALYHRGAFYEGHHEKLAHRCFKSTPDLVSFYFGRPCHRLVRACTDTRTQRGARLRWSTDKLGGDTIEERTAHERPSLTHLFDRTAGHRIRTCCTNVSSCRPPGHRRSLHDPRGCGGDGVPRECLRTMVPGNL